MSTSPSRRGRVAEISAYLDPGAMLRSEYDEFVEKNGCTPTWRPKHSRNPNVLDGSPLV